MIGWNLILLTDYFTPPPTLYIPSSHNEVKPHPFGVAEIRDVLVWVQDISWVMELEDARARKGLATDALLSTHSMNNSWACPMCGGLCQVFRALGRSRTWFRLLEVHKMHQVGRSPVSLSCAPREFIFVVLNHSLFLCWWWGRGRGGGPWRGGGGVDKCLCDMG